MKDSILAKPLQPTVLGLLYPVETYSSLGFTQPTTFNMEKISAVAEAGETVLECYQSDADKNDTVKTRTRRFITE